MWVSSRASLVGGVRSKRLRGGQALTEEGRFYFGAVNAVAECFYGLRQRVSQDAHARPCCDNLPGLARLTLRQDPHPHHAPSQPAPQQRMAREQLRHCTATADAERLLLAAFTCSLSYAPPTSTEHHLECISLPEHFYVLSKACEPYDKDCVWLPSNYLCTD
jgi:hypothetical protein